MHEEKVELSIQERVANGAAFLDQVAPEWWTRINAQSLNLNSPCDCVLGQLYDEVAVKSGGWMDGYDYARYEVLGDPDAVDDFGFDVVWSPDSQRVAKEYKALEREWIKVIKGRFENA